MTGGTTQNLKDRVARLEAILGGPEEEGSSSTLFERVKEAQRDVETMQQSLGELSSKLLQRVGEQLDEQAELHVHRNGKLLEQIEALQDEMKAFSARYEAELGVIKKAISGTPSGGEVPRKLRVPEPLPFTGVRSAKELENFLWDMEQYFKAAHIPENERVNITSMYLSGDAKLWWRTRLEDAANAGKPSIETWKELQKELRDQFLPCNTAWVARDALKKLRHTTSVREYVKQFSSLMLDIKDMSEADKLYNFMSGLQVWAQLELRRQGVRDVATAIAAADGLVDFHQERGEGEKEPKAKSKFRDNGKRKQGEEANAVSKGKPNDAEKLSKGKRDFGCFICGGPHRARDCPKKEQVNALRIRDDQEEDAVAGVAARVNPLQVQLGALQLVPQAGMVPPSCVQVVDAPQVKGTGRKWKLTSKMKVREQEEKKLRWLQRPNDTVAKVQPKHEKLGDQGEGHPSENFVQPEAMMELPQLASGKDRVKAPESSPTQSTRASTSSSGGGLSRP